MHILINLYKDPAPKEKEWEWEEEEEEKWYIILC